MGFFSTSSEKSGIEKVVDAATSLPEKQNFFVKWQGELILLFVFGLLAGVCYAAYRIGIDLYAAVQEHMSKNDKVGITSKGVNIKVKSRTQESTLDSAQRFAYNAWLNSKAPDSYHGKLKWREQENKVSQANATAGANSGWA